jgi:hypothetical protein
MVPGIAMILRYALKHPGDTDEALALVNPSKKFGRWTLIFLVLLNEFVMGWAFILASGNAAPVTESLGTIVSTLNYVAGSDWFLFTLSAEILFSIYMLRRFFSSDFIRAASLQSLILIFVPTAIGADPWPTISLYAGILLFAILLTLSYRQLWNRGVENQTISKYLRAALLLEIIVIAGLLIWETSGNDLVLLVGLAGETVLYFNSILERVTIEERARIPATVSK